MHRNLSQWRQVKAQEVAESCSPAHIENLLRDAVDDIAELEAERDKYYRGEQLASCQCVPAHAPSELRSWKCPQYVAELEAENAKLKQDAARLDYVIEHDGDFEKTAAGVRFYHYAKNDHFAVTAATGREAVAIAMKEQAENANEQTN